MGLASAEAPFDADDFDDDFDDDDFLATGFSSCGAILFHGTR
jgi:hypothetical protein